jgi:hypothetical protein
MWKDPIVEEIRKNSEKLAADVDYDKNRFIENLRKNQLKSKKRLVSFSKRSKAEK